MPARWIATAGTRSQGAITAAALLAAIAAGLLLGASPILGVALLAAGVFVPLAFANPPLALAGWVTLAFLSGVPGTRGAGANYALLVVLIAWVGALAAGRTTLRAYLRAHPRQAACAVGLVVWAMVTLLWAPRPQGAGAAVLQLAICVGVFVMTATLLTRPDHVRWVALGFVAGTTLSVLLGAAGGGLRPSAEFDAGETARLAGTGADPNYLAAAIVPAIVLAASLAGRKAHPLLRLGLLAAVAVLGVGLAATESRGGFLATAVVCAGALILLRERRREALAFVVVLVSAAGLWFAVSPGSWQRVSSFSDGGSGRTDIWQVAERVAIDHPVTGVGLSQFPVVSRQYLSLPGEVARGDLLVSRQIVVHNLYLQLWAETGVIGLLLFISVAAGSLAAGWRAARTFAQAGDDELATLARASVLAVAGALTASVFLSNVDDRRSWVLLALGPALLAIARTQSRRPVP